MRPLPLIAVLAATALLASGALADQSGPTTVVSPVENFDGIIHLTVSCQGAPNTATCSGNVVLPQLDPDQTPFGVAPGRHETLRIFVPGPLHAQVARMKTVTVTLTQVVAGVSQTASADYPLTFVSGSSGSGGSGPGRTLPPGAQGKDAPTISRGPKTGYEVVHDPRGDARSSFPLPQLFDITLASARRRGQAVVLAVVNTLPIYQRDSGGNLSAPCVEIPYRSAAQHGIFLFGNGQLSGYRQHYWPKVSVHVHGGTISWTVPRRLLAARGFSKGFLWRAAGGCDPFHLGDLAPNHGFQTFRWVKVG